MPIHHTPSPHDHRNQSTKGPRHCLMPPRTPRARASHLRKARKPSCRRRHSASEKKAFASGTGGLVARRQPNPSVTQLQWLGLGSTMHSSCFKIDLRKAGPIPPHLK
jgi:hypothetical protein